MVKSDKKMAPEWSLEESLKLLTLFDTQLEWRVCAENLTNEFAFKRSTGFFTAKTCKDEFDRIICSGHPEHFIRQKGEKYSQKELIKAWIVYLQKQVKLEYARQTEMLLIKMREKAAIFNRIFSEDNPLTDEEIAKRLEEARLEDSKRDPEVVKREVEAGMEKIAELRALHEEEPEKYPPLRIVIPPSRPVQPSESSPSAAPFSPIKPLFDGLNWGKGQGSSGDAKAAETNEPESSGGDLKSPKDVDVAQSEVLEEPQVPQVPGAEAGTSGTGADGEKLDVEVENEATEKAESVGESERAQTVVAVAAPGQSGTPEASGTPSTRTSGGDGGGMSLRSMSPKKLVREAEIDENPDGIGQSGGTMEVTEEVKGQPSDRGQKSEVKEDEPVTSSDGAAGVVSSIKKEQKSDAAGEKGSVEDRSVAIADSTVQEGKVATNSVEKVPAGSPRGLTEGQEKSTGEVQMARVKLEAEDVEGGSMEGDGIGRGDEISSNETKTEPTVQESTTRSARSVGEGRGGDERHTQAAGERRQLRNQNRGEASTSAMGRSGSRAVRMSPRKASADIGLKGDSDQSKGQVHTPELRSRKSSASGGPSAEAADGPPSQSLRSRRGAEKTDEGEEPVVTRRRSERRRVNESSVTPLRLSELAPPTRRKRTHDGDESASVGGVSGQDSEGGGGTKEATTKRRKLSLRDPSTTATNTESSEKHSDGSKIVETHIEIQSSPEPEGGESTKGTKGRTEEVAEKPAQQTVGRRGSLRSAGGVKEVESRREERGNAGGMVRTRASDGMPPSAHPRASASAILESDEEENDDEEENKPLGDIRSDIIAAKKETAQEERESEKSDKVSGQNSVEMDEGSRHDSASRQDSETKADSESGGAGTRQSKRRAASGLEKQRGRPRREVPSSGVDTVTTPRSTRSESSRHPMGSSRRRSRRDELDETTIEQKAFMTSVWRMVSSHRHAAIFAQPVSDSIARGYSKVVKNRMDLQTLKKQVDSGRIADMLDFKRRLLLMFANAVMFNSTGHDVNNYAKEMADDSLNALRTMQKDILNMKEGAHVTRRAAAAEEASLERRRRSAYLSALTPSTSTEKLDSSGKDTHSTEKERSGDREKDNGKVRETHREKDAEKTEKKAEESGGAQTNGGGGEGGRRHHSTGRHQRNKQ